MIILLNNSYVETTSETEEIRNVSITKKILEKEIEKITENHARNYSNWFLSKT